MGQKFIQRLILTDSEILFIFKDMKVILIGATGLVGGEITRHLVRVPNVDQIEIFSRRELNFSHEKINQHIVDFSRIDQWKEKIHGDILFSALGTTLSAAGTKKNQYLVDHDYQLKVAHFGSLNGVKTYVLISSVNADAHSLFFYLRMKGELEEKIRSLPFTSISILRPGPLSGKRENIRFKEILSTSLLTLIPESVLTPSLVPVEASKVSEVAIQCALEAKTGVTVISAEQILRFSSPQ